MPHIQGQPERARQFVRRGQLSVYYASVSLEQGKTAAYVTPPDISQSVTNGQAAMRIFSMAIG